MSCLYWSSPCSSAALRGLSMENHPYSSLSARFFSSQIDPTPQFSYLTLRTKVELIQRRTISRNGPSIISSYSDSTSSTEAAESSTTTSTVSSPPVIRKRRRYRKQYPGEKKGITEEMRFVAMRLRNVKGKKVQTGGSEEEDSSDGENDGNGSNASADNDGGGGDGETWQPSMEGFVKYLVDSKLVFDTIERIVDESSDVSYAYFRKTGLERSEALSDDLKWFCEQDIEIPPPSNPGVTYAQYLEELSDKCAPLFLCHFYNIYFSHIAGGQVIAKQVSEKLLEGRELQFYRWEGNAEELLKNVRQNLNILGEHWSRDEKNKCLREATKSFRHMGQIVRLIVIL